jgi:hypothetical protein
LIAPLRRELGFETAQQSDCSIRPCPLPVDPDIVNVTGRAAVDPGCVKTLRLM